MTAPVIFGTAAGIASNGGSPTTTIAGNAGDVVVVFSYVESGSGSAAPGVASVTGGGLAFSRRGRTQSQPAGAMEIWWAVAPAAFSGVTLQVSYDRTYDDSAICALIVSGCDTSAPWDAEPSLPAEVGSNASFTPSFTVTTRHAPGLLLFAAATNGPWSSGNAVGGSGFGNGSVYAFNSGAVLWSELYVSAKAVDAAQTAQSFTWGAEVPAGGQSPTLVSMFDALAGGGNATAPAPVVDAGDPGYGFVM